MAIYNPSDILDQLQRYVTATEKVKLVIDSFQNTGRLLNVGVGPRYAATLSALANEVHELDAFPDSIENCRKVIQHWEYFSQFSPLKEELEVLGSRGLKPKFENIHYLLNEKKDGTISYEDHFSDGILAVELFLHLSHQQAFKMLSEMQRTLTERGKAIVTCYFPSSDRGIESGLDDAYADLAAKGGLSKPEFYNPTENTIDIKAVSDSLDQTTIEQNRRKFWLDLGEPVRKIKLFPYSEIHSICENAGFGIVSVRNIRGGMFPFADRGVYLLENLL